jgi:hypothetical protein
VPFTGIFYVKKALNSRMADEMLLAGFCGENVRDIDGTPDIIVRGLGVLELQNTEEFAASCSDCWDPGGRRLIEADHNIPGA